MRKRKKVADEGFADVWRKPPGGVALVGSPDWVLWWRPSAPDAGWVNLKVVTRTKHRSPCTPRGKRNYWLGWEPVERRLSGSVDVGPLKARPEIYAEVMAAIEAIDTWPA